MRNKKWNTRIRARVLAAGLAGTLGLSICGCGAGVKPSASADAVQEETQDMAGDKTAEQGASEQIKSDQAKASLSGEIREISERSFTLNQIMGEDSGDGTEIAVLPVEDEAMTLVTVSYDEKTVFTRRTIESDGESYEDSEGSPEELKAGDMVELQGSYEGEIFRASQVRLVEVQ